MPEVKQYCPYVNSNDASVTLNDLSKYVNKRKNIEGEKVCEHTKKEADCITCDTRKALCMFCQNKSCDGRME